MDSCCRYTPLGEKIWLVEKKCVTLGFISIPISLNVERCFFMSLPHGCFVMLNCTESSVEEIVVVGRVQCLEVDGEGPLLDGLDVGVDDRSLLDGVGGGDGGPGWQDVGAGGESADDAGLGGDAGVTGGGEADGESLGGGDQTSEGSQEFHGGF